MNATPDIALALIADGQYQMRAHQPVVDSAGERLYEDRDGVPLLLSELLEQSAGQRLSGQSVWNNGSGYRRDVSAPRQPAMFRDPYDETDPGQPFSASTRATAAQIAAQYTLVDEKPTARFRPLSNAASQAWSRWQGHPDFTAETMRTRAASLPRRQSREVYDEVTGAVTA